MEPKARRRIAGQLEPTFVLRDGCSIGRLPGISTIIGWWHAPLRMAIVIGLCWLTCGCRTPDPTVDLLESELRWLEDNLYMMDDQLEQCCDQLASARRNNAALRGELKALTSQKSADSAPQDNKAQPPFDPVDEESLFEFEEPVVELGDSDATESEKLAPENSDPPANEEKSADDIRLESMPDPEAIRAPQLQTPNPTTPPGNPFGDTNDDPAGKQPPTPLGPGDVTQIHLNQQLTGGYDLDGRPGADGVMVVVEPRDQRGNFVPTTGEVSIAVYESTDGGRASRLARWDFDSVESAAFQKQTLFGRGLHFELPWPAEAPSSDKVHIAVSFDTPRGRRLHAERIVQLGTNSKSASPLDSLQSAIRKVTWTAERINRQTESLAAGQERRKHSQTASPSTQQTPLSPARLPVWTAERR